MTTQLFRATALGGLVGATLLLAGARNVDAQGMVASDRPAGFVVLPKLVSDPLDSFNRGQTIDTVIQLTNTDRTTFRVAHCFYINATGICLGGSNPIGGVDCRTNEDCTSGVCNTAVWQESNFTLTLTAQQPTGWVVSQTRTLDGNSAGSGIISPVPTDYFQGELKCVEVNNATDVIPINRNDLKAEATTYYVGRDPNDPNTITSVDVRRYNGIGFPALGTANATQSDRTLCLGGNGIANHICQNADYAGCPERLIVNHLFEGAGEGIEADPSVTLVPCTEFAVLEGDPTSVTVQMLIFNEFEQRFSLSTRVDCYRDIRLRDLSILYDVGTQGTVAGQTVLRGAPSGVGGGYGIIGIAEQDTLGGSTAYNVVYSGMLQDAADQVTYVAETEDPNEID